jgi:hypothetical protein
MSFNKVNKTTGKLTQIEDILIDSTPTQGSTNAVQSGGVYAQIQTLTNYVTKNNVKNFLIPYVSDSNYNNVSFTINSDKSVTVVGTASATCNLDSPDITGLSGRFTLSGCPTGGGSSTYQLWIYDKTTSSSIGIEDTGSGATGTLQADHVYTVRICVQSGYTIDKTFYPMLRDANITDPTYAPYAKTNRELTEKTASIESDISAINTQLSQLDFDGAGAHNSIYRGKYLGAEVTAEQYAHIADGTFKDMYIGDYWTINGVNYRIGHFDYWLRTGDTECTTHHVLIVTDTKLADGQMNSTYTTAGGYIGSDLKTGANDNTALATAKNIITMAFGSAHILTHREYFTNAGANGKPSAGAWYDSDIDLMNENMVYGTNIFLPHPDGSTVPNLYTIDKTQIKLFAERPDLITNRAIWWLRDVVSDAYFADVYSSGGADYGGTVNRYSIRPAFGLRA